MTPWRSFVGRVARLRRSIVRLVARAARRRRPADEELVVADEAASGPPAHWVERVREGAPGLLEPSLRQRSETAGPPAAADVLDSPGELEPPPDSSEVEPDHEYVPREPPVDPRPPRARARLTSVRKVLRRKLFPSAVAPAVVAAPPAPAAVAASPADGASPPAPTSDDAPRELHTANRRVREAENLPSEEPPGPLFPVGQIRPTPVRPSPPVADEPEPSPQSSEVVEFEAPPERLTVRRERNVRPHRTVTSDAARVPATEPRHEEHSLDDARPERVWETAVAPRAPRREPDVEHGRELEPASQRPAAPRRSSVRAIPPSRRRDEPPLTVDINRWPELPPPLDHADDDVDVALRAWERQRRLDREQTRL